MSEKCPNCLSWRIGKNNYGKKTAGVLLATACDGTMATTEARNYFLKVFTDDSGTGVGKTNERSMAKALGLVTVRARGARNDSYRMLSPLSLQHSGSALKRPLAALKCLVRWLIPCGRRKP